MLFSMLAAAAAPTAPLQPSGPWNVHADYTYCMLTRPYGVGPNRIEVAFQPNIGDRSMTTVIGTLGGGGQATGSAKITRQPDGLVIDGNYYSVRIPDRKMRVTQVWTWGEGVFASLDRTTALRIKAQPVDITIAVVRIEKAKVAFRACEDGLLESWGIKPATVREGTLPVPTRPVSNYFRPDVYPKSAMSERYIGQVRAALVVGADGLVKDCRIANRIGPAFDKIPCERARLIPFAPGLDRSGAPAQSLFQLNVRWALP